jgi:uncharacterized protein YeaO (DUF488 family)
MRRQATRVGGLEMSLKTKSVKSPIDRRRDGLRILATRFRGRGLPPSQYDVWMASLGPSERLLKRFQGRRITWRDFARLYRRELEASAISDRDNRTIKNRGQKFTLRLLDWLARIGHVTLLCHCPEGERHCHIHLLKIAVLKSAREEKNG